MTIPNADTQGENIEGKPTGIPITLIIAWVPIAGYVTAFGYQRGAAVCLHISSTLIVLNLTSICIGTISISFATLLIFALFYIVTGIKGLLRKRLGKPFTPLHKTILSLICLLPIVVVLELFAAGLMRWCVLAIALAHISLSFVLSLLPRPQGKRSYDEEIVRFISKGPALLIFLTLLFLTLSLILGYSAAVKQNTYEVVNTTPEAVVLWHYDHDIVCAYFDRDTKEIRKSQFVLNIAGGPELTLTREKVGPLHFGKE